MSDNINEHPTIEDLIAVHGPRLNGLMAKMRVPTQCRDDILQDVWRDFARAIKDDPVLLDQNPGGWLWRVTQRRIVDYRRATVRKKEVSLTPSHLKQRSARVSRSEFDDLIFELTLRERELISMRYREDLELSSIAMRLHLSVPAVNSQLARARNRLREKLTEQN